MTTTLNASTAGAGGFIATSDNSGVLALQTGGTTAITVDTSQKVGIGTTSPANSLNVYNASAVQALFNGYSGIASRSQVAAGSVALGNNPAYQLQIDYSDASNTTATIKNTYANSSSLLQIQSGYLTFGTGTSFTEAMRIDSSGVVLVNTSSPVISGYQMWIKQNESAANYVCLGLKTDQTSNRQMLNFVNGNGLVGTINTSGSATTYNTSSDYRLKENITPMTGALAKVAQLKPVKYKWKVDGADGEGFIAHELAEVCPHAVSGEKDAVDAEGNPQYQGIDTSFLVATLTAGLQELKALNDTQAETINALTARIVALETA